MPTGRKTPTTRYRLYCKKSIHTAVVHTLRDWNFDSGHCGRMGYFGSSSPEGREGESPKARGVVVLVHMITNSGVLCADAVSHS